MCFPLSRHWRDMWQARDLSLLQWDAERASQELLTKFANKKDNFSKVKVIVCCEGIVGQLGCFSYRETRETSRKTICRLFEIAACQCINLITHCSTKCKHATWDKEVGEYQNRRRLTRKTDHQMQERAQDVSQCARGWSYERQMSARLELLQILSVRTWEHRLPASILLLLVDLPCPEQRRQSGGKDWNQCFSLCVSNYLAKYALAFLIVSSKEHSIEQAKHM